MACLFENLIQNLPLASHFRNTENVRSGQHSIDSSATIAAFNNMGDLQMLQATSFDSIKELNAFMQDFSSTRGFSHKSKWTGSRISFSCTGKECPYKVWFYKEICTRYRTKEQCRLRLSNSITVLPVHGPFCTNVPPERGSTDTRSRKSIPVAQSQFQCLLCHKIMGYRSIRNHMFNGNAHAYIDFDLIHGLEPDVLENSRTLAGYSWTQWKSFFDKQEGQSHTTSVHIPRYQCKLCHKIVFGHSARFHLTSPNLHQNIDLDLVSGIDTNMLRNMRSLTLSLYQNWKKMVVQLESSGAQASSGMVDTF